MVFWWGPNQVWDFHNSKKTQCYNARKNPRLIWERNQWQSCWCMHLWGHVKGISSKEAVVLPTSKIILCTSRGKLPTQLSVLEDKEEWLLKSYSGMLSKEHQWGKIGHPSSWEKPKLKQTWISALKPRNQDTKERTTEVSTSCNSEYTHWIHKAWTGHPTSKRCNPWEGGWNLALRRTAGTNLCQTELQTLKWYLWFLTVNLERFQKYCYFFWFVDRRKTMKKC